VEAALAQHPRVIEAAAFAVAHPTLGEDVAAAVVLRRPTAESELRNFVLARLAAFKIPGRIIEVAQLPRATSGKIDRAALARFAAQAAAAPFEPAVNGEEAALAQIFADVLQVPRVGRHDNFFHLGGDSLRGMRVVAAVEATLGATLTLEVLFDHPTIAELAAHCARLPASQVDTGPTAEHGATATDERALIDGGR